MTWITRVGFYPIKLYFQWQFSVHIRNMVNFIAFQIALQNEEIWLRLKTYKILVSIMAKEKNIITKIRYLFMSNDKIISWSCIDGRCKRSHLSITFVYLCIIELYTNCVYIFSFANAILKFTLLPRKILLLKWDCKRNKSVLQLHNVSWNVVSHFTTSTTTAEHCTLLDFGSTFNVALNAIAHLQVLITAII